MANTFVYDGVEVRLTGREAFRRVHTKVLRIVEVTPIEEGLDWKKWVNPEQLYKVVEKGENDANG